VPIRRARTAALKRQVTSPDSVSLNLAGLALVFTNPRVIRLLADIRAIRYDSESASWRNTNLMAQHACVAISAASHHCPTITVNKLMPGLAADQQAAGSYLWLWESSALGEQPPNPGSNSWHGCREQLSLL
jgi:hypothetical protein